MYRRLDVSMSYDGMLHLLKPSRMRAVPLKVSRKAATPVTAPMGRSVGYGRRDAVISERSGNIENLGLVHKVVPTETLPNESALRGQFSVSRSVRREDVRGLVSNGLLDRNSRPGARMCLRHRVMNFAGDDADRLREPDFRFHQNILQSVNNSLVQAFRRIVMQALQMNLRVSLAAPLCWQRPVPEHRCSLRNNRPTQSLMQRC
jgi:hypothetical protein